MLRERARRALAAHTPRELPLTGLRPAGVLVLLHDIAGDDYVVFQQRTHGVRHHKGEISFPGGARDPEDTDLLFTALRETQEEIGVPPEMVDVYGQLDDTQTYASNYLIRPYVGAVDPEIDVEFVEAAREVRELLHVPLEHLLSAEARIWKVAEREGVVETTPAYGFEDYVIWGATARMLGQFLALIDPEARHAAPEAPEAEQRSRGAS
jgi:8-oxo-dGTP pyrophosphatase MutT (NUDIX family)